LTASEVVVDVPRAELRRAVRRLDWRFLLPNATLGRVAYLGPADGSLVDALRASGAALLVTAPPVADADRAAFDTVVAVNPSDQALAAAADLLRTGGWLYAEVSGRAGHAGRIAAQARGAGFGEVQRHWHWPDFERGTRILPLDDGGALVYALVKGRRGAAGTALAALVRGLQRVGALGWAARCVSLTAQREGR
jgi:SAM-dependent methyltransferase